MAFQPRQPKTDEGVASAYRGSAITVTVGLDSVGWPAVARAGPHWDWDRYRRSGINGVQVESV